MPNLALWPGKSPYAGSWGDFIVHIIWILSLRTQTRDFSMSVPYILLCPVCLLVPLVSDSSVNQLPFALSMLARSKIQLPHCFNYCFFCYGVDISGSSSGLFHWSFGNTLSIHIHLFFTSSLESIYLWNNPLLFIGVHEMHRLISRKKIYNKTFYTIKPFIYQEQDVLLIIPSLYTFLRCILKL